MDTAGQNWTDPVVLEARVGRMGSEVPGGRGQRTQGQLLHNLGLAGPLHVGRVKRAFQVDQEPARRLCGTRGGGTFLSMCAHNCLW